MKNYTLAELEAMPTLCVGQADNLKVKGDDYEVWLSRCSRADGEPFSNKVTVIRRFNDQWIEECIYEAQ